MNKTVALYRREVIKSILLRRLSGDRYVRVSTLHDYVVKCWPDGYAESPHLNTIYRVLEDGLRAGIYERKYFGRGCYSYACYRLCEVSDAAV